MLLALPVACFDQATALASGLLGGSIVQHCSVGMERREAASQEVHVLPCGVCCRVLVLWVVVMP